MEIADAGRVVEEARLRPFQLGYAPARNIEEARERQGHDTKENDTIAEGERAATRLQTVPLAIGCAVVVFGVALALGAWAWFRAGRAWIVWQAARGRIVPAFADRVLLDKLSSRLVGAAELSSDERDYIQYCLKRIKSLIEDATAGNLSSNTWYDFGKTAGLAVRVVGNGAKHHIVLGSDWLFFQELDGRGGIILRGILQHELAHIANADISLISVCRGIERGALAVPLALELALGASTGVALGDFRVAMWICAFALAAAMRLRVQARLLMQQSEHVADLAAVAVHGPDAVVAALTWLSDEEAREGLQRRLGARKDRGLLTGPRRWIARQLLGARLYAAYSNILESGSHPTANRRLALLERLDFAASRSDTGEISRIVTTYNATFGMYGKNLTLT